MNKLELEKQLEDLRKKWKVFPKSYLEPNWWKFKCDKTLALRLIHQIEKLDRGEELTCEELNIDQIEKIFE